MDTPDEVKPLAFPLRLSIGDASAIIGAAIAIYLLAAIYFDLGFFEVVGPSFQPIIGVKDTTYAAASFLPGIGTWIWVSYIIAKVIRAECERRWPHETDRVSGMLKLEMWLNVIIASLVVVSYLAFDSVIGGVATALLVSLYVLVSIVLFVVAWTQIDLTRLHGVPSMAWLMNACLSMVCAMLASMQLGRNEAHKAIHAPQKYYTVRTKVGKYENVRLLRTGQGGCLLKIGDNIVLVYSSEIQSIEQKL